MDKTLGIVILCILVFILVSLIVFSKEIKKRKFKYSNKNYNEEKLLRHINKVNYTQKPMLTSSEKKLFFKLKEIVEDKYFLACQVNLASIIYTDYKYKSELFRNIDFGIFDKKTLKIILLIELNDETHKTAERYTRDLKVRRICEKANIPLLTLYSGYPNEINYIQKRIKQIIPYF